MRDTQDADKSLLPLMEFQAVVDSKHANFFVMLSNIIDSRLASYNAAPFETQSLKSDGSTSI